MKTFHSNDLVLDHQELSALLAFSLRYALTRRSYAPGMVLDILERNLKFLGPIEVTKLRDLIEEEFLDIYTTFQDPIMRETRHRALKVIDEINTLLTGDNDE